MKKYIRGLIVRAIEDACVLLMLCVGTAGICAGASLCLRWLGVG